MSAARSVRVSLADFHMMCCLHALSLVCQGYCRVSQAVLLHGVS